MTKRLLIALAAVFLTIGGVAPAFAHVVDTSVHAGDGDFTVQASVDDSDSDDDDSVLEDLLDNLFGDDEGEEGDCDNGLDLLNDLFGDDDDDECDDDDDDDGLLGGLL